MNTNSVIIILVVLISTGAILAGSYIITDMKIQQAEENIKEAEENIKEEMKYHHALEFGGEENYDIAEQVFTSPEFQQQQEQQLQTFLDQQDMDPEDLTPDEEEITEDTDTEEWIDLSHIEWYQNFEQWQVDINEIQNIKEEAQIKGNNDATISWIEYSDVNCPFCVDQAEEQRVDEVFGLFEPDEVNYIKRHFPVQDPSSEDAAEAIICAENVWDEESFFEFKNSVYTSNSPADEDTWRELAWEYWIPEDQLMDCIDGGEYENSPEQQLEEWQTLFRVTGTPGNVFVNNNTWDFVLVPWAFPAQQMEQVIEELLNQ